MIPVLHATSGREQPTRPPSTKPISDARGDISGHAQKDAERKTNQCADPIAAPMLIASQESA